MQPHLRGGDLRARPTTDAHCAQGKETITFRDLRERLLPFYPEMPVAELKFLMVSGVRRIIALA